MFLSAGRDPTLAVHLAAALHGRFQRCLRDGCRARPQARAGGPSALLPRPPRWCDFHLCIRRDARPSAAAIADLPPPPLPPPGSLLLLPAPARNPALHHCHSLVVYHPAGFVVLHNGQPVVLASAAAVYPLLPPHRRQLGSLAGTGPADLVPGAQLAAVLPDDCNSSCGSNLSNISSSSSGDGSTTAIPSASSSLGPGSSIELRLVGMAELPGVRHALARLLAAPSSAGPGGWQLGWLLHQQGQAAEPAQLSQLPAEQLALLRPSQLQSPASPRQALTPDMLAVASHVAVLQAATPAGAQALQQVALPWPDSSSGGRGCAATTAALQMGRFVTAVGAPFGVLAPQHFTAFLTTGIISAAVRASGSGSSQPALLLADLRCSPGMDGGPVFAGRPIDAAHDSTDAGRAVERAAAAANQQPPLLGMLLPPLKAPAVHVEWATVAPVAAVAAAAEAALGRASDGSMGIAGSSSSSSSSSSSFSAAATESAAAAAAAALQGVVAVAAGGSWASGVVVSEAGHILTNAHLLQPAAIPPTSGRGGSGSRPGWVQLQPSPAAASSHPVVQVLLPGAAGSSGEGGAGAGHWASADVLYVFQGPLDLAVLKLRHAPGGSEQQQEEAAWRPLRLSRQRPRPGQPVLVAGYPAYSPRSSPLGSPVLTAGSLAKVRGKVTAELSVQLYALPRCRAAD